MAELNIQEKITELVNKIKGDENLKEEFTKEPIKTIEKLTGLDLPDEKMENLVSGVKAALTGSEIKEKAEGLVEGIKGIFGK